MLYISALKRMVGANSGALRTRIAAFYWTVRIKAARRARLDGCTFNLTKIADRMMKIALISKEYEEFERRAALQYIHPEYPLIELGGCVGVVACVTNRALKGLGSHIVVEANPFAIPLIEENRARNHCNFEILNAAIAYDRESVVFYPSLDLPSNSLNRRDGTDPVEVKTVRLGDIVKQNKFGAFNLICDIEGHEYDLVQHEIEVLKHADTIVLETHVGTIGEVKTTEVLNRLYSIGFRKVDEDATVVVLKRAA
jgi:FkbM family methyltransferase